ARWLCCSRIASHAVGALRVNSVSSLGRVGFDRVDRGRGFALGPADQILHGDPLKRGRKRLLGSRQSGLYNRNHERRRMGARRIGGFFGRFACTQDVINADAMAFAPKHVSANGAARRCQNAGANKAMQYWLKIARSQTKPPSQCPRRQGTVFLVKCNLENSSNSQRTLLRKKR